MFFFLRKLYEIIVYLCIVVIIIINKGCMFFLYVIFIIKDFFDLFVGVYNWNLEKILG